LTVHNVLKRKFHLLTTGLKKVQETRAAKQRDERLIHSYIRKRNDEFSITNCWFFPEKSRPLKAALGYSVVKNKHTNADKFCLGFCSLLIPLTMATIFGASGFAVAGPVGTAIGIIIGLSIGLYIESRREEKIYSSLYERRIVKTYDHSLIGRGRDVYSSTESMSSDESANTRNFKAS